MAFSSVLLKRYIIGNGVVREVYSWNGAGVTTGAITPDTTDAERIGTIKEIDSATSFDNVAAVRQQFTSAARASITLTFTSGDTGNLVIEGKSR